MNNENSGPDPQNEKYEGDLDSQDNVYYDNNDNEEIEDETFYDSLEVDKIESQSATDINTFLETEQLRHAQIEEDLTKGTAAPRSINRYSLRQLPRRDYSEEVFGDEDE